MPYLQNTCSRLFLLLLTALLPVAGMFAQLNASFTTDKPGGCAPALIQFTTNSSGASANAIYKWDLGNGNTSALANPSATYEQEKDYTISLTITDGGQTSTATRTITVYKRPTVDFTVASNKFCLPDAAIFQSQSTAGSGSIQTLTWDFGDGNTQTSWGGQQMTHYYQLPTLATVTLTATNNHGCHSTLVKKDLVRVLPEVKPAFEADKLFVCRNNDKVKFTNTSTGPGTLSYLWDFGDGTTSTVAEPEHVFSRSGAFNVALRVTSSEGCVRNATPVTINVENFVTSFSMETLLCQEEYHVITNTSSPTPTETIWTIGNNSPHNTYGGNTGFYFNEPGDVVIKMENRFGTCVQSISRTINIKPKPPLQGFIAEQVGKCGAPDTIRLRDTTPTVVSWAWRMNFFDAPISTQKEWNFRANNNGNYYFDLTVTNAHGCTQRTAKNVFIRTPGATIQLKESSSPNGNQSCGPFTATFAAIGTDEIVAYNWTISGTVTSTLPEPTHTFSTAGTHLISLSYRLANGCTGTTSYSVTVFAMPVANFTAVGPTDICGPTPAVVQNASIGAVTGLFWNFDYDNYPYGYSASSSRIYEVDTLYTVALIAVNGTCRDTIIKKDFFRVLPPFPRITQVENTCDGTRGKVTFTHATVKGITGTWTFGDGSTAPFNPAQPTISHTYNRTGSYDVTLTVTNGPCTISDTRRAYVLLKQNPVFAFGNSEVCANEAFTFSITNIEANPHPGLSWDHYYFNQWEYRNNQPFEGSYNIPWNTRWYTNINGTAFAYNNSPNDVRAIFTSAGFGCQDTTNLIPLRTKGANAGFTIVRDSLCWQQPVTFRDTSSASGSSNIVSRTWNFGDGRTQTTTQGGLVTHQYANPGNYQVKLSVTDAGGCTVNTSSERFVTVSGPKASFSMSGYSVPLNQTIYFSNNTNTGYIGETRYEWQLGDGTTSTDYYPVHTYPVAGTYTIRLIAINTLTGCRDTAFQTLVVRPFNTAFQMNQQFVNSDNCPPLLVRFNNTSYGGVRVEWDFGDGTGSVVFSPAKVYSQPGKFLVTLRVFGYNGLEGAYYDSVMIGKPTASFAANPLFGCTSQNIAFTATQSQVSQYTWDFGDGTTRPTTSSPVSHNFLTPGIYQPRLLISDSNGCTQAINTPDKIIIDSLFIALNNLPGSLCDSARLDLRPDVRSVGGVTDPGSYTYEWRITHNGQTTTIRQRDISYAFNQPGTYRLSFNVQSPYGCNKTITDSLVVVQGVKALISGALNGCIGVPATFTGGTSIPAGGIGWQWRLGNTNSSNLQNPPAITFNQPGSYPIELIASIGQCADTARQPYTVHPNPALQVTNRQPVACLGTGVQLQVSGADLWAWTPAASLSNATIGNPVANPATATLYRVTGTSTHGCQSRDSIMVTVASPISISLAPAGNICQGQSLVLNATGGATAWRWIGNTAGLSNTNTASPTARPATTTTYTVAGTDAANCFSDTASIVVTVNPLPAVNAGPDQEVVSGAIVPLNATATGNIAQYLWAPATYLSCTTCPNPVATPITPMQYTVTVTTDKGCTATDTVQVLLTCGKSYHIPNAFTPDGDGKNDFFYVLGGGGNIRHIRIYDRWGKLVFERRNAQVNDRNSAWDGKVNGMPAPTAAYVYMVSIECTDGTLYEYKGTVTLIR